MFSINLSELIWTVINFFLLLFLLNRFLYKPLTGFMAERQARINEGLQKEQDAKACLEKNEERLLEKKAESQEEAKKLLAQNAEELEKYSAEMLKEAKRASVQDRKTSEEALAVKQEQTAEQLRAAAPELATVLAEHLLGGE